MSFAVEFSGPRRPRGSVPALRPGWRRRTTTIDVVREDMYGPASIDARGRDALADTGPGAGPEGGSHLDILAHARLVAEVDVDHSVMALTALDGTNPPPPDELDGLRGARTNAGFRRAMAETLGQTAAPGTLWHLLLDDFVGAVLVSGVAPQHSEAKAGGGPIHDAVRESADLMRLTMSDLCSGWATEATMLRVFDQDGRLPVACGPDAPDLTNLGSEALHEVAALLPHGVRRMRRLDVAPTTGADDVGFDVHFRDTHVDDAGIERCVHEYSVEGAFDPVDGTIRRVQATAHVLPWQECPGALVSPQRVVGRRMDELRDVVRTDFRGVTTCTHLNDTLRSLADLTRIG